MSSDPSTDTGWTFFHIKLLQKLQCLFEKDIKCMKRGRKMPIFKRVL